MVIALLLLTWILPGCIRHEAPNAEADILGVSIEGVTLLRPTVLTNNTVTIYLHGWEDATKLAPCFELTPGAKIHPASGTPLDFSKPQTYTVTSEDGAWSKEYQVSVAQKEAPLSFDFEHARFHTDNSGKKYFHIFYEPNEDGTPAMDWATGNLGFSMTNQDAPANAYPTYQTEDGYRGKAAALVTRSIPDMGFFTKGKPIAAGSLFLGNLNTGLLLFSPLKATEFGMPLTVEPAFLGGYYRYTPGPVLIDKDRKVLEGKQDTFDLYAIVFDTSNGTKHLDGTNSLTHPDLVLLARIKEKVGDGKWHHFLIPFEPQNGKSIDPDKLREGKYSYSIVFSSSLNAAKFEGAVDSHLTVDEIKLFTKEEKAEQ